MPKTPLHSLRMDSDRWELLKRCAEFNHETVTAVLVDRAEQYIAETLPKMQEAQE